MSGGKVVMAARMIIAAVRENPTIDCETLHRKIDRGVPGLTLGESVAAYVAATCGDSDDEEDDCEMDGMIKEDDDWSCCGSVENIIRVGPPGSGSWVCKQCLTEVYGEGRDREELAQLVGEAEQVEGGE